MRIGRLSRSVALLLLLVTSAPNTAQAQTAICYNCPPEWADWSSELKAIKDKLGITVPQDNKNSGQALAQLVAEKASPVADVVYLGVTFGIQAKKEGVIAPYKPAQWDDIPAGQESPGVMVTVEPVAFRPVERNVESVGTLYGYEEVAISAKVEGSGITEIVMLLISKLLAVSSGPADVPSYNRKST